MIRPATRELQSHVHFSASYESVPVLQALCFQSMRLLKDAENLPTKNRFSFSAYLSATPDTIHLDTLPNLQMKVPHVEGRARSHLHAFSLVVGDRGYFALAPPHQGIDGEWTDDSGVIVYRWNEEGNRPNTGRKNWRRRWTCCQEYEEDAPPCRKGPHVSYDDGYTMH